MRVSAKTLVRAPWLAAFMVLLLFPAAALTTLSMPYRWANVTLGGGGFAPGVVFSPAERGLVYLRTDMGGAYRWEDKAGRWVPLQDGEAEPSLMGVESIAPDPVDANRVYMAAGMHKAGRAAMLHSEDRGDHWTIVDVPFRMGGNEDGRGLGERLAVDPNATDTLLFGTRHNGLWRSDDRGAHWRREAGLSYAGRGVPAGRATNAGISFVVFDPRPGVRRVYAGVADAGDQGLWRSDDGGSHWARVPGGPTGLLPVKAAIGPEGRLYVTYANGIGPNGVTDGAVWSVESDVVKWSDITPPRPEGGFIGVAVDRQHPGTVLVSTFNRWHPVDTIWRSGDAGKHWSDLGARSRRDTSTTPFLNWGKPEADFGHWVAGLAIDPFDPNRVAYTTGATMYVTREADAAAPVWTPWTQGIEQTAVITLISPMGGAHLVSGFGDLGGFVHADLAKSPPGMFLNPRHSNTNMLDYAGRAPDMLVRSGNVHAGQAIEAGLGISIDGGRTWTPLRTPNWGPESLEANGRAPITLNADGARIFVGAEQALYSDDAKSWHGIPGLPAMARIVTDKVDPKRAWVLDYDHNRLLASGDAGTNFAPVAARGLCPDLAAARPRNRESQSALVASPFAAGELYLACAGGLYHSTDGGARFVKLGDGLEVQLFGLGKGAIFAIGTYKGQYGIWRSSDGGANWVRINDDQHQWGNRFRAISGDPRIFGRVYVATDGRGIVYGDPR